MVFSCLVCIKDFFADFGINILIYFFILRNLNAIQSLTMHSTTMPTAEEALTFPLKLMGGLEPMLRRHCNFFATPFYKSFKHKANYTQLHEFLNHTPAISFTRKFIILKFIYLALVQRPPCIYFTFWLEKSKLCIFFSV